MYLGILRENIFKETEKPHVTEDWNASSGGVENSNALVLQENKR